MELEDALGRRWQCPTCQLDFNLPERFDLTFEGSDGKQHRPVMIHRAVLGSLERCFAMLVENYAGKFPLWLSPVQVRLLPIADRHIDYCKTVEMQFRGAGIRVETDERALTTPNKVRLAQTEHVNYILVVGDSEIKNSTINVRTRDNTVLGEKAVADVIAQILKEVGEYK
jgi:threonyl-tRNA synthetase